MDDLISKRAAIDAIYRCTDIYVNNLPILIDKADAYDVLDKLPSVTPKAEQRWVPVTKDTLPEEGKVVIVKGLKGTWDFGTYRGFSHINGEGDIHRWLWKKNTSKSVYWWMYKDDALPEPYREEGGK